MTDDQPIESLAKMIFALVHPGSVMTDDQLIESLRARTWQGDCEAAAFRLEELRARVAELEALPGNVLAQGKRQTNPRKQAMKTNGSKPESVNAELLERISNAMQSYERHGAICTFEGSPMIYASTLTEIADIASEAQQVEKADDLVGLRGCNSRHGGIRSGYPCIYRMRTTDPGCTGCADRDEDQPKEAGG